MARRVITVLVIAYAFIVVVSWIALEVLSDRFWPVTLFAFGPRWLVSLPLFVLGAVVPFFARRHAPRLLVLLTATGLILALGVMDVRLGLGRVSGVRMVRLMTHNVGASSRRTAAELNEVLRMQGVDIATLQECGLQLDDLTPLGWHVHAVHNQCVISRYPIASVDVRPPLDVWQQGGSGGINRYELQTPLGRLSLLTVHLETIRDGLEAVLVKKLGGLHEFSANRRQSDIESRLARGWSERGYGSLVVAGDFNLPVESAIYRRHWGHLTNAFSSCGRGLGHTKNTRWFGIRIDHVLMSDDWRCANARVLPESHGGDHSALIVDLVRR